MKKLIIWAALLCLLLTACANTPASPQMNAGQPTTVSTTTSLDGQPSRSPGLTINGLDEYNEFVEQADLPEDFVRYESLTQFGELRTLVILSQKTGEYSAKDYSNYMYSFVDEKGTALSLKIGYMDVAFRELLEPVESKYWGDLQPGDSTIEKNNVIIVRNGVEYIYLWNRLYAISWEIDGIPFMITTDCEDKDVFYPEDGPLTFVQELLHTDTNKAAMESFKTALEKPAVK